jgi:hypothetical protein
MRSSLVCSSPALLCFRGLSVLGVYVIGLFIERISGVCDASTHNTNIRAPKYAD